MEVLFIQGGRDSRRQKGMAGARKCAHASETQRAGLRALEDAGQGVLRLYLPQDPPFPPGSHVQFPCARSVCSQYLKLLRRYRSRCASQPNSVPGRLYALVADVVLLRIHGF